MHGFTKALALEIARKGVTANTISPGYIGTKMVMAIPKDVLDSKIIPQIRWGGSASPRRSRACRVPRERRGGVPDGRQHRDQRRPAHVLTGSRDRPERRLRPPFVILRRSKKNGPACAGFQAVSIRRRRSIQRRRHIQLLGSAPVIQVFGCRSRGPLYFGVRP
jgi:hypothetical protein